VVVYTNSDAPLSGSLLRGAPGKKQIRINHMISNVPPIEPMTMPAMAPPEMELEQLPEDAEVDCLG